MLDIHIGITREELYKTAALSAQLDWTRVHLVRGATNIYELRKQGYSLGTYDYVSYVDDDDIFLGDLAEVRLEIEKGTPAIFTNLELRRLSSVKKQPMYHDRFKWQGVKSYQSGIPPHNPYFIRRDLALSAVDRAYNRILRSDDRFLKVADPAIAFEIQLICGWTYIPKVCYTWFQSKDSNSKFTEPEYVEISKFYLKLIKDH